MTRFCIEDFRVKKGQDLSLATFPTRLKHVEDQDYRAEIAMWHRKLKKLQTKLYASRKYGVVAAFQGLDAAGKDSIPRRVFAGCNIRGVVVTPYKRPTEEELQHDWLWRHEKALPPRGMIGIWDRTHLEEVGAVRVHPEMLRARGVEPSEAGKKFWADRMQRIREFEEFQFEEGVLFVKFFLHGSAREQALRMIDRIQKLEKNWKFSDNDLPEMKYRDQFLEAYSKALAATSTKKCPWYVIPADDKRAAALLISQIMHHHFKEMKLEFPKMDRAKRRGLAKALAELKRFVAETEPSREMA